MRAAQFTPGPWALNRMESAVEIAALKGETLAEHEGYYRTNSGAWIVTFKSDDEDMPAGPICEVSFKGSAKRGEAYKAPDPEGQANARLIAAAPELYEALNDAVHLCDDPHGSESDETLLLGLVRILPAMRAALAKARGEQ